MKNAAEILERYYQSFINQKRDWNFFLGLADYVKYAVETQEINNILKRIVRARENDQRRLKKYEQKVIKETKQAKKKLFKIIKKHKISYESLDRAIKEYQEYESGAIISSRGEAEALSGALQDIIRNLFKNGYKDLIRDFAIEHKEIANEIGKYTFSKTLDLYYKEKEIFEDKKKTELWASWNNLVLVYLTIFRGREEFEKLKKDARDFLKAWNFGLLLDEMRTIRDGNRLLGTKSTSGPIFFIKNNYISHATRIHNYLIKELSKEEEKKETKEDRVKYKSSFDEAKGVLTIGNKEIKIKKFTDQYHLLRIIFENQNEIYQEWFFSEISEKYDSEADLPDKKFYNATYQLKQKIARETGIKDFFITTTQSFKINPKYLKKS